MKKAGELLYDEYNGHLVVEQLARSSQFGNKCSILIEFDRKDSELNAINETYARGKGSVLSLVDITDVKINPNY